MTDFTVYKLTPGTQPWWSQFHSFVDAIQLIASEVETARGTYTDLNTRISSISTGGGGSSSAQIGDVRFGLQAPSDAFYWGVVTPPGITLDIATYPDLYDVLSSSSATSDWTFETVDGAANLYGVTHNGTNYIAVGDNIQYSSDGGDTWNAATGEAPGIQYNAVASDGGGGNVVAVGNGNTISRSTNNGGTWSTSTSPLTGSSWIYSAVGFDGSNFVAIAYNTTTNLTGVCTSTTGATWTKVSEFSGLGYAITAKSGRYVIGGQGATGGQAWYSDNLVTWTTSITGAYNVYAATSAFGYFVLAGQSGLIIYSTTALPGSWSQFSPPSSGDIRFISVDTSQGIAYAGGSPTNSGSQATVWTWDGTVSPGIWVAEYVGAGAYLRSCCNAGVDNVVVGTSSTIFKRSGTVGDITVWSSATPAAITPTTSDQSRVFATSTGRLLLFFGDQSVAKIFGYYSDDDGANWTTVTSAYDTGGNMRSQAHEAAVKVCICENAGKLVAVMPGNGSYSYWPLVYISTDDGTSWTYYIANTGISGSLGVATRIEGIVYDTANSRYLLATADGTALRFYHSATAASGSWTLTSTITLASGESLGYPNCLNYDAASENIALTLTTTTGTTKALTYSTDGGATWSDSTNTPTGGHTITRMTVNPSTGTILIAIGAMGTSYYRSTDGGATYTNHSFASVGLSSLANADNFYPGPGSYWIVLEGSSTTEFYLSDDDGLTWTAQTAGSSILYDGLFSTGTHNGSIYLLSKTYSNPGDLIKSTFGQAVLPTTFFLPYLDTPTNVNSVYNMYVKVL